jgi:dTDP-4-dehydrorhamnose 3,5-epimerase-like enzyme
MSEYCCPTIADNCSIIQLPKIHDPRGNLTFVEGLNHISFKIKRMYWIYDVPGGEKRGGHAYKRLHELIIAVSGSFDVVLDDGREKSNFTLNRSYYGLYVPNLIWRSLENFSTNSLCLILASDVYNEDEYIRDYNEFLRGRHEK